jgi:hypothetical protein
MIDVIQAAIDILTADPEVSTLTNGAIFDSELGESEDFSMPTYAVVVQFGGGPGPPLMLQFRDRRLNIICYGPTDSLCDVLYEAVEACLRATTPQVQASTYVHWINPTTGPMYRRDPQTEWPYITSSWLARVSTLTMS